MSKNKTTRASGELSQGSTIESVTETNLKAKSQKPKVEKASQSSNLPKRAGFGIHICLYEFYQQKVQTPQL